MGASWESDKCWSDRFVGEIKDICGPLILRVGSQWEDQRENTDLVVLYTGGIRIGARIRRWEYLARFGGEFTIRVSRPAGTKTELEKIIEGWGSHFFYGFSDEKESRLASWFLGDLRVFRSWYTARLESKATPWIERENSDGSSGFRAFALANLPESFVLARKGEVPVMIGKPKSDPWADINFGR